MNRWKNMLNALKLSNFCNTTLVTCHQNTVKICSVSESNPSLSEAISEAILHCTTYDAAQRCLKMQGNNTWQDEREGNREKHIT